MPVRAEVKILQQDGSVQLAARLVLGLLRVHAPRLDVPESASVLSVARLGPKGLLLRSKVRQWCDAQEVRLRHGCAT